MSAYTPGPWVVKKDSHGLPYEVTPEDGVWPVAKLGDRVGLDALHSNGSLIAAAPDLLEAAHELDERLQGSPGFQSEAWAKLRAAIVKAEGGAL